MAEIKGKHTNSSDADFFFQPGTEPNHGTTRGSAPTRSQEATAQRLQEPEPPPPRGSPSQVTTPESGYPRTRPRPATPHALGPGARRQVQVPALQRGGAGRGERPPAPPPTAPPRPHPQEPTGRIAALSKTLRGGTTNTYRTTGQHRVPAGSFGKQPQAGATSRPASPARGRLLQENREASTSNDRLCLRPAPSRPRPPRPRF